MQFPSRFILNIYGFYDVTSKDRKDFYIIEQQMINTILSSDKIFLNKEAKSELI